jgi:hypothetical protein
MHPLWNCHGQEELSQDKTCCCSLIEFVTSYTRLLPTTDFKIGAFSGSMRSFTAYNTSIVERTTLTASAGTGTRAISVSRLEKGGGRGGELPSHQLSPHALTPCYYFSNLMCIG